MWLLMDGEVSDWFIRMDDFTGPVLASHFCAAHCSASEAEFSQKLHQVGHEARKACRVIHKRPLRGWGPLGELARDPVFRGQGRIDGPIREVWESIVTQR